MAVTEELCIQAETIINSLVLIVGFCIGYFAREIYIFLRDN